MKNFRLLAASLFASSVVTLASAQSGDEINSLRAKAEKGNGLAQYNLGLAYAEGRGVAADKVEAFVWLSLARDNGARGKALETLTASLDANTLAAARERLASHRGGVPVVSTTQAEPEIVTTVKTTAATPTAPADNATLAQQIAILTADKKQLSEEVAKAWKEIDTLNAALAKSEQELRQGGGSEAAQKISRALEANLKRTTEEKAALEEKLAQLTAAETARRTPSAETAALREQLGNVQNQLTAVTAELTSVRATETALHDQIAGLEQEKARLAAAPDLAPRVGELEAKLAQANQNLTSQIAAADAVVKKNSADLSASAAEVIRLQKIIAAQSTGPAYPDLSGKVGELEANLAKATTQLSAAELSRAALEQKLAAATAAASSATQTGEVTARLEREKADLANRVSALNSENAQLRADRETMQQSLAQAGKQAEQAGTATARVAELEAQVNSLQNSVAAAQNSAPAYPDLSGRVRELEASLATANRQAESAVQTATSATEQTTKDLSAASARIAQLEAALAAKSAPVAAGPDLSGRVRELEAQLADSTTALTRAKQEAASLAKARDEAQRERGPAYPNLAGRVVELQTALADTKRELGSAQAALRAAQEARTAALATPAPVPVVAAVEASAGADPTELQKQLAESESKLSTALHAFTVLQRDQEEKIAAASKGAEGVTAERDALAGKVAALTTEVEQLKLSQEAQLAAAKAESARAAESLAAFQRTTAQNTADLAAARALLQQVQGASTVLANENYQLKTRLAAAGVPAATVAAPSAPGATAATGPASASKAAPSGQRVHVIAAGDTLFRISQRYYDTPNRWQEIYRANSAKLGTNGVLRVGVELVIP